MKKTTPFLGLLLVPFMTLPACGGKEDTPSTATADSTGDGTGDSGMTTDDAGTGDTTTAGDGDSTTTSGDGDTAGDGDGTTTTGDGDGCGGMGNTPFRVTEMDFRDPHFFVNLLGCQDLTDGGIFVVNDELQNAIDGDASMPLDGILDLSIMQVFRPLEQGGCSGTVDIGTGDCLIPADNTSCSTTPMAPLTAGTYTTQTSGDCLIPDPATLGGYSPAPNSVSGSCYLATSPSITVSLGGIEVPLSDVEIAAVFDADPATMLMSGLLKGFMSETVANSTILPMDLPILGGNPISQLLPGGAGNCSGTDDRDMHNGEMGWWFYADFVAEPAPWTD